MTLIRNEILNYLAAGQATAAALIGASEWQAFDVLHEIVRLEEENLITSARVECPRFRFTVYRLTEAGAEALSTKPEIISSTMPPEKIAKLCAACEVIAAAIDAKSDHVLGSLNDCGLLSDEDHEAAFQNMPTRLASAVPTA